ncbi:hypothetical protein NDA18_003078 [Ustilago nuda]|nr:hypothetical protein NDA18_003078 [Ustilago nuda]
MLLPASLSSGPGPANTLLVAPSSPGSGLVAPLQPASLSYSSGLSGSESPITSLGSGLGDQRLSASLPSTTRASSTCSAMLGPSLDFFAPLGIANMSSDLASALLVLLLTGPALPARPNTACELPIFDHSDTPATIGSLKLECWAPFLDLYPDQGFANQLRGALRHGVLLGYSGPSATTRGWWVSAVARLKPEICSSIDTITDSVELCDSASVITILSEIGSRAVSITFSLGTIVRALLLLVSTNHCGHSIQR